MDNQMEVLRGLYKAQVELIEAYEKCTDTVLKEILLKECESLEATVCNIEDNLNLFGDDICVNAN